MFKTLNLKPFLFLLVLLNVLSLHIYLFYTFSVSPVSTEIKNDSNYIVTLTMLSEVSEDITMKKESVVVQEEKTPKKVAKVDTKPVLVQKINNPKKVDKKVTQLKEKLIAVKKPNTPKEVVKKENLEITDTSETQVEKEVTCKEIQTDESKSAAVLAESHKREKSVADALKQDEYLKEYISYINRTIEENKFYPKVAKNMGIEGKCTIMLTILNSGIIENTKIVEKSYFSIFDKSALKIIDEIESFKAFPYLLKRETVILKIPIKYTLKG